MIILLAGWRLPTWTRIVSLYLILDGAMKISWEGVLKIAERANLGVTADEQTPFNPART
jgi:hypothetical protein